ncbi:uncharacterized mitochondrial protein AtMg00810-like [Arachis duranensis]|uniref:Uncharacterized mitochondrial protein AtMg00810-like n=1 Tax=Arachis duranensis TaxID=130453 RepID=A0A6P4DTM9_ARADU|nr:uncharacterized mitochondrial protein AtMg00810-like [Arachis duranensis]
MENEPAAHFPVLFARLGRVALEALSPLHGCALWESLAPFAHAEKIQLEAIDNEFKALTKCGTWFLVDLPPNATIVGCKWVYAIKKSAEGLEAHYLPEQKLLLTQTKYAKDLLHYARMHNSNPMPTPMMTSLKMSKNDSDPYEDPKQYRSIAGALQYLTITRPDLAFVVNKVSQFMHSPTIQHWKAVKRILRYLEEILNEDSDWTSDLDDRRSITGYCIYLGTNLIAWRSDKQSKIIRSTTEEEYRAIASA